MFTCTQIARSCGPSQYLKREGGSRNFSKKGTFLDRGVDPFEITAKTSPKTNSFLFVQCKKDSKMFHWDVYWDMMVSKGREWSGVGWE